MKSRKIIILVLVLIITTFNLYSNPTKIILAAENADSYPWSMKDETGLNNVLLKMVSSNIGIDIVIELYPWKRCLASLEKNQVDGVFAASFKEKRKQFGVYPELGDGSGDKDKRLHMGKYSLFVVDESKIKWDGKSITYSESQIGAPAGYSIVDQVKGYGIEVYEAPDTPTLMKMLIGGRISAVATLSLQGEAAIKTNKQFSQIKEVVPPLVEKPYYLMLSHSFVKQYPELAKKIWNEIEKVRNSDEYKAEITKLFGS